MGLIIFLPPNFNYENHHEEISITNSLYIPNTFINRVYKSKHLIVYEIEHFKENEPVVTIVSSQKNSSDIKLLYKELRYEPISDLITSTPHFQSHIHVFGVVLSMIFKEDDPRCTTLQLFDFNPKAPITVKLWRGLATWITSLSIGARIQIRNLVLKDATTLHSCSTTEIYLLAHGKSKSAASLSARANNLNEKEREILLFLSHQSLLIPSKQLAPEHNCTLRLTAPIYLEHKNNKWTVQDQNATVNFSHFDAKIWQLLNEILMDNSNKFNLLFEYLTDSHEYLSTSQVTPLNTNTTKNLDTIDAAVYKRLDWPDLISSKVILFGVYVLEAIFDLLTFGTSDESLGNLSILPNERATATNTQSQQQVILRNPNNLDQFVYTENTPAYGKTSTSSSLLFRVQVKTILNDGNVNEIIRKIIFIL